MMARTARDKKNGVPFVQLTPTQPTPSPDVAEPPAKKPRRESSAGSGPSQPALPSEKTAQRESGDEVPEMPLPSKADVPEEKALITQADVPEEEFQAVMAAIVAIPNSGAPLDLFLEGCRGGFTPYALKMLRVPKLQEDIAALANWAFKRPSQSLRGAEEDEAHPTRLQVRIDEKAYRDMRGEHRLLLTHLCQALLPLVHTFTHRKAGTWTTGSPFFTMAESACAASEWSIDSWVDFPVVAISIWGHCLPQFLDTPWFHLESLPQPDDGCADAFQALPHVSTDWSEPAITVRPRTAGDADGCGDGVLFWSTAVHRYPALEYVDPKLKPKYETHMLLYVPFPPANLSDEDRGALSDDTVTLKEWQAVLNDIVEDK
jgi:hypothetical protein